MARLALVRLAVSGPPWAGSRKAPGDGAPVCHALWLLAGVQVLRLETVWQAPAWRLSLHPALSGRCSAPSPSACPVSVA